jgi:hypothetical protein
MNPVERARLALCIGASVSRAHLTSGIGLGRRLGVVVAVALAAIVGLPAPAGAAVGEVRPSLSITPVPGNPSRCTVKVHGHVVASQAEAQTLLAQGHRIVVRLWGSDFGSDDDLLYGPWTARATATARGLDFDLGRTVGNTGLNEDSAWGNEGDEVYAGVRLLNSAGHTVRSATTNKIGSQFGLGCDQPHTGL